MSSGQCRDPHRRAVRIRPGVDDRRRIRRGPRNHPDDRHGHSARSVRLSGRDPHDRWQAAPTVGSACRLPGAPHWPRACLVQVYRWRQDDRRGRCGCQQAGRSGAGRGQPRGGRTVLPAYRRSGDSRSRNCDHRGRAPAGRSRKVVADRDHRMSDVPPRDCPSRSFCPMPSGGARHHGADRRPPPRPASCGERRRGTGHLLSPKPLGCGGSRRHGRPGRARRCPRRHCLCPRLRRPDSAHWQHETRCRFAVGPRAGHAGRRLIRLTAPSSNHSSSSRNRARRSSIEGPGAWARLRAVALPSPHRPPPHPADRQARP